MLRMGFAHVEMRSRKVFPKGDGENGRMGGLHCFVATVDKA